VSFNIANIFHKVAHMKKNIYLKTTFKYWKE